MSRRSIVLILLAVSTVVALGCGQPAAPESGPPAPAPPPTDPPPPADSAPAPVDPPVPVDPPPPPARACAGLKELACINSDRCTLVVDEDGPGGYGCRDSRGPCETGFRQRGGAAEACEAKPGCRFVPGRCYCAPDVTCICGGGPPAQCVEESPPGSGVGERGGRPASH